MCPIISTIAGCLLLKTRVYWHISDNPSKKLKRAREISIGEISDIAQIAGPMIKILLLIKIVDYCGLLKLAVLLRVQEGQEIKSFLGLDVFAAAALLNKLNLKHETVEINVTFWVRKIEKNTNSPCPLSIQTTYRCGI